MINNALVFYRIIATILGMVLFSIPLGIGQDDQIPMVLLVIGAVFVLTCIFFYLYRNKVLKNTKDVLPCDEDAHKKAEESKDKKAEESKDKKAEESKDKKSQKGSKKSPFVILVLKDLDLKDLKSYENNYTDNEYSEEYSEDEYLDNSEDDFFMEKIHYPFSKLNLNLRSINRSNTQERFWTWSMGRVYFLDEDINRKLVWVWVRIHFYYPTPVPTSLILRCSLSEDLSTHSLEMGDYVVLEYDANVKSFGNRTFSIIKIEKNR